MQMFVLILKFHWTLFLTVKSNLYHYHQTIQAGKLALARSPMRVEIWPREWKTGLGEWNLGYIRDDPVQASATKF